MPSSNESWSRFWSLGGGVHKELGRALESQLSGLRAFTLIDEMTRKFFL